MKVLQHLYEPRYVTKFNRAGTLKLVLAGLVFCMLVLTHTSFAQEEKWEEKEEMPTARYVFTTSVVDGKIYAIGGWPNLRTVEMYDPIRDRWIEKASMSTGRGFLSSAVVNGKIYAIDRKSVV